MAGHPTFSRGHCFMTQTLNKPEVEEIGPLVFAEILKREAAGDYAEHLRRALAKMDYPEPPRGAAHGLTFPAIGEN